MMDVRSPHFGNELNMELRKRQNGFFSLGHSAQRALRYQRDHKLTESQQLVQHGVAPGYCMQQHMACEQNLPKLHLDRSCEERMYCRELYQNAEDSAQIRVAEVQTPSQELRLSQESKTPPQKAADDRQAAGFGRAGSPFGNTLSGFRKRSRTTGYLSIDPEIGGREKQQEIKISSSKS